MLHVSAFTTQHEFQELTCQFLGSYLWLAPFSTVTTCHIATSQYYAPVMEWTKSMKRNRTGIVYSETIAPLAGTACKRYKSAPDDNITVRNVSRSSRLESLPTEILQQVFITAANGNLIAASPVVGMKLSGSGGFYCATFMMAFYSHMASEMFEVHQLRSYKKHLGAVISSWDVRSLTRAILEGVWCTYGLVKSWLDATLRYAIDEFRRLAPCGKHGRLLDKYLTGQKEIETLIGAAFSATDSAKRSWQLEPCMWDIRITRHSDVYKDAEDEYEADLALDEAYDEDALTAQWAEDLVREYQMRFLGVMTIGDEKWNGKCIIFDEDERFGNVIELYSGLNIKELQPQPSTLDFFELLEERALRATRNTHWLRETLALDYYLRPEFEPFKISPQLYRTAAAVDMKLERQQILQRHYFTSAIHVLFNLDPSSLPRTDTALRRWEEYAVTRLVRYHNDLSKLQIDVCERRGSTRNGVLRRRDANRFRACKVTRMYCYEMDLKVLKYIRTGEVESAPASASPDFTEPLPWLGEKLSPWSTIVDHFGTEAFPNAMSRDLDILAESLDNHDHYHQDFFDEIEPHLDGHLSLLTEDEVWDEECMLDSRRGVGLDQVLEAIAHKAIRTFDSSYQSWYYYNGRKMDMATSGWDLHGSDNDEDFNNVNESDDNLPRIATVHDSHNPPQNIHYGEYDRSDPMAVDENFMAMDRVVMRLAEPFGKDTDLPNPMFRPPKWFQKADKAYMQELPLVIRTTKTRRRSE
jgi:hypothetical protein